MDKIAHTPTPYTCTKYCVWSEPVGPEYEAIYVAGTQTGIDKETQAANAAFIVRCCNNHETALSLLNSAMEETQNESLKGRIAAFLATDKA